MSSATTVRPSAGVFIETDCSRGHLVILSPVLLYLHVKKRCCKKAFVTCIILTRSLEQFKTLTRFQMYLSAMLPLVCNFESSTACKQRTYIRAKLNSFIHSLLQERAAPGAAAAISRKMWNHYWQLGNLSRSICVLHAKIFNDTCWFLTWYSHLIILKNPCTYLHEMLMLNGVLSVEMIFPTLNYPVQI